MNITPINGYILVKVTDDFKETKKGGIILQNPIKKGDLVSGIVVKTSKNDYCSEDSKIYRVKVNDIVKFDPFGSQMLDKVDDEQYYLVNEENLKGIEESLQ